MKKQFLSDSGLTELIGYIKRYIISNITWGNVTGKPTTFPPENHSHDDRYFTETEINTKLAGKADSSHKHTKAEITDFPTSMPASDVPTWAKQASKPAYTKSEVGLGSVDNTADKDKSVKYATSAGTAGTCTGNAATATKLASSKNISITGGATAAAVAFDGSANVDLNVTAVKLKWDTEENWLTNDPVLLEGELAFTSNKYGDYKIGDGNSKWSALSYAQENLDTIIGYLDDYISQDDIDAIFV